MQTVNEAAKEYAVNQINKLGIEYDSEDCRNTDIEVSASDFKAGVKFAQRWIPVVEELPEERVFVLCQNPCSAFVASFHGKEKGFRIPNAEGEYKVTHWRPIEYPLL